MWGSTWSGPTGREVYAFISLSVSFASWLPCCCFCCLVTRDKTVTEYNPFFFLEENHPGDELTACVWAGWCPALFPAEKQPSEAQRLVMKRDNSVKEVKHYSQTYPHPAAGCRDAAYFKGSMRVCVCGRESVYYSAASASGCWSWCCEPKHWAPLESQHGRTWWRTARRRRKM